MCHVTKISYMAVGQFGTTYAGTRQRSAGATKNRRGEPRNTRHTRKAALAEFTLPRIRCNHWRWRDTNFTN
jgi:hypothetical protein